MFDELKNTFGPNTISGKDPHEFTIRIEGTDLTPMNARLLRTFDNPSDSYSASLYWNPDDKLLSELLKLDSFRETELFLGGESVFKGHVYNIKNIVSVSDCKKEIEAFTNTIGLVDSSVSAPYEYKNVSFRDVLDSILNEYDYINYIIKPEAIEDSNIVFKKVKSGRCKKLRNKLVVDQTKKEFEFLSDLARQRQLILSNDNLGNLVVSKANTNPVLGPVTTLTDNLLPGYQYEIESKGRERFSHITCFAKSPGRKNKVKKNFKFFTVEDENVPLTRRHTFDANDLGLTDLEKAAKWERSKKFAESFSINYPVNTWYSSNGVLWEPNTMVTVISNYLELPNGFDFFVRSVEYSIGPDGPKANLGLIPPQAFTGDEIKNPFGASSDNKSRLQESLGL